VGARGAAVRAYAAALVADLSAQGLSVEQFHWRASFAPSVPDPGDRRPRDRPGPVPRLPSDAPAAADALAGSAVLAAALGPELHDAILTVRRAEAARCADLDPVALTSAVRWRW
jgi:hypothetical protein